MPSAGNTAGSGASIPMGANAGEPHNIEMQTAIVKAALCHVADADRPGIIKPLPQFEYHAKI